jgi:hypothetical protein
MDLKDFGFFLLGRANVGLSRMRNRGGGKPVPAMAPDEILGKRDPCPLDLVRLLEGRSNDERSALVGRCLEAGRIPFSRHPYSTFEGRGENWTVDVGHGEPLVIFAAHHDAVPGSPGANDNAAAVAILLGLARRLLSDPPSRIRVRLLFTGSEEICYLGARCYVKEADLEGLAGVLSLELCGIGDQLAVWDVVPPFERCPFLACFSRAAESLGFRAQETYHLVGRVPVFGSDHRPFAALGIPAFGLTVAPGEAGEALRRFVFNPWKAAFHQFLDRPPPFDTYHTRSDRSEDLDRAAMYRVHEVLFALAHSM